MARRCGASFLQSMRMSSLLARTPVRLASLPVFRERARARERERERGRERAERERERPGVEEEDSRDPGDAQAQSVSGVPWAHQRGRATCHQGVYAVCLFCLTCRVRGRRTT
jgi:hypothetical protein